MSLSIITIIITPFNLTANFNLFSGMVYRIDLLILGGCWWIVKAGPDKMSCFVQLKGFFVNKFSIFIL